MATPQALVNQLRSFLPSDAVLHETEDVKPYECDGLSAYRQTPMIVVLPQTEEQVIKILQLCYATKTPVVARGAGTGLSGGALPNAQGILLSLAKLKQIVGIDVLARTARVQPGVRNLAISEAAKPYGLYYAPDPSSQIACSIGGNIAENSGGVHCLKYGLTVHNILKLRVLTIEGEVLEIGGDSLDSAGYDLLALMTGSEGMLGIVTEITVKLLPVPETAQLVMAGFDDVQKAGNAVANVIAAGIIPAGMEMMDKITIHAVEEFLHAGYDLEAAAILLCESDGSAEEVADEIERINVIMKESGATKVSLSRNEAERLSFWAGRKSAFPAAGRVSPDYYCMDGTIPRKHLADVLSGIEKLSEEYGLRCMNVFHAGDGNLHPLILYDANIPGELERTEEFGGKILEMCIHAGGTITGEHGVGMEKINQMCTQFRTNELAMFHAVKAAFDPEGLLNPGKAVPTLRRCAELGAMHVHSGEEKFPELPRFRMPIEQYIAAIRQAAESKTPIQIRGGGSKDFYGNPPATANHNVLDVTAYNGIVEYESTELVVTARAGTRLADLEAALNEQGQMLAFEPPYFGENATLGGCVAAGLSGPRRVAAGSVRDFVLGVRVLDGKGDDLRFGGQVMKNVAGYDVSRLMVGAMGTLGVLLEVSLKVLPRPATELTLQLPMQEAQAIEKMNQWAGQPLPISASCFCDGTLTIRLSGAESAVRAAHAKLGGEVLADGEAFWQSVREQSHDFFQLGQSLWRLSIKSTSPPLALPGQQLIEWHGALRWLVCDETVDTETIRKVAKDAGGHATLFRGDESRSQVFHPLEPGMMTIHRTLKQKFDPTGILNPGRLYPEL